MAQITLTIPDAVLSRVIDGICNGFSFATKGNPGETKGQFSKRMIVETVKGWVAGSECSPIDVNAEVQKTSIRQDVDTNIQIS